MSTADQWYQQHVDGLSDALQEFINEGGAAKAQEALNEAITTWVDYHQKELDKWTELKNLLHLPEQASSTPGSQVQSSKSFSTPLMPTGNRL